MIRQENNIRKLINFHWVFIKKNPILWTLAIICSLVQIITIITLDILNKKIYDYSLLLFLIPNILYTIFVIFLIYNLFQSNKDNSIDNKLLCSKYDYYKIKLARFSLIWMFLACIIVVSDLGLFYFPVKQQTMFGIAVFISNTFVTPFIFLLITILFTILAIKTPTSVYMIVTILICIVTFGLSLITRILVPSISLNQDNYYKLIQKDSQYLVEKTKTNDNLNQTIITNTCVPSEWFYSLYSGVFAIDKNIINQNSTFSIRDTKLKEIDYNYVLTNDLPIMIRETDFDFLSLSNSEYIDLICSNIEKIVKKYNLLNNFYLLEETSKFITNNFEWIDFPNESVFNLLKDITGINTDYNQLYYLIKYNQSLKLNVNILISNINERFDNNISNLFEILIESENTFYNLFKSNNEFNSQNIYPNEYSINQQEPIMIQDSNFIKNTLIKFLNDSAYYLNNDGSYYKFDISILQSINSSIVNEQSYKKYIDEISITYKRASNFISDLISKNNNILNYQLSKNYLNLNSIYKVYKFQSSNNVSNIEIFIGLITFFNAMSCISFFVRWKGDKNE